MTNTYRSDPRIAVLDFTRKALWNISNIPFDQLRLLTVMNRKRKKNLYCSWIPPCWLPRRDWSDTFLTFPDPCVSCRIPDVDLRASKQQTRRPFAFWNFYISKGTRVAVYPSHVCLSAFIPLGLKACGSFFREEKLTFNKGKRMFHPKRVTLVRESNRRTNSSCLEENYVWFEIPIRRLDFRDMAEEMLLWK